MIKSQEITYYLAVRKNFLNIGRDKLLNLHTIRK